MPKANDYIQIKRNKLFWHYVIRASNGQILGTSETYYSKGNAIRAAQKLSKRLGLVTFVK